MNSVESYPKFIRLKFMTPNYTAITPLNAALYYRQINEREKKKT